ncbi:MAG TPA: hypothetical protein VK622_10500, partial [Puia sp.]|nr:hypothetical protein [Puia sp.]
MDQDQPKRIRRYASTFGILILLAAVLGFYYFKYVPERRTEYNKAAFLELSQIEHALRNQDGAYYEALKIIVCQKTIDSKAFDKFYLQLRDSITSDTFYRQDVETRKLKGGKNVRSGRFNFIDALGDWHLLYPAYDHLNPVNDQDKTKPVYKFSKNADTLMSAIVSTYKDIFNGYLL